MSPYSLVNVVLLAGVVTLAAYMARVYSEFGKILSREVQDNLDAWEQHVEPRLGMRRESASKSVVFPAPGAPRMSSSESAAS